MNDIPFNNRRPTEMEDEAHVEAVRHFAEPLKQFPTSRDAVKHLERDVAKTAWLSWRLHRDHRREFRFWPSTAHNGTRALFFSTTSLFATGL